jgi:hypothetical protein
MVAILSIENWEDGMIAGSIGLPATGESKE